MAMSESNGRWRLVFSLRGATQCNPGHELLTFFAAAPSARGIEGCGQQASSNKAVETAHDYAKGNRTRSVRR